MAQKTEKDGETLDEGARKISGHCLPGRKIMQQGQQGAVQMECQCIPKMMQRRAMTMEERLQEPGDRGKSKESGKHTNAVDAEALEPLFQVVPVRLKDEKLIAKVRHCNVQRSAQ